MFNMLLDLGGRTIVARVLEQPKEITSVKRDNVFRFIAKNGISIKSNVSPELRTDSIFIRGSDSEQNDNFMFIKCPSIEQARELFVKFCEAIEEWTAAGCPMDNDGSF